ncbi:hypothetical protein KAH94_04540, partial [bacterium]|nr:hypothetical protein [bacterium]
MRDSLNKTIEIFISYLKEKDYAGHDPYDGLNSQFFKNTSFYKNSLLRLLWIQFFRRSPLNLRKFLQVPQGFIPKAGALFVLGYSMLYKHSKKEEYKTTCFSLFDRIKNKVITRPKGLGL